jgi:hypothetical protein
MPRTKLTGKDRDNFIKAKIWFAGADAGVSLMRAIDTANRFMANEIREKAKNAIKGRSRPDSKPFPRDQLAKTTGQFRKNSVARPGDKPPRYYRKNSLHKIFHDQGNVKSRNVYFKQPRGSRTYKYAPWIAGPIRGGTVNPKYTVGSKTVARKVEFGGVQMRRWRKVPAIKQRGKRNATWDGEWRTEFAGIKGKPPQDKPQTKRLRYLMMAQKGWIPWQKLASGQRDYNHLHEIPWQKGMFTQRERKSYMIRGRDRALQRKRRIINKAKMAFPKFARKFVKFNQKNGYYI